MDLLIGIAASRLRLAIRGSICSNQDGADIEILRFFVEILDVYRIILGLLCVLRNKSCLAIFTKP